eukprot:TRINITY_DN2303_c0_g1_i2.p1 TRINITY_DN2303_c0_g1~~TRINITY_DN2303_c0_g1_i2.p1  ORF type:complete len:218 (-),score=19.09 TRINITY_DN2303_c0_g1_i2:108-761(-)
MQDVWEKQRFYPLKGWSCKLLPNDGPRWAYADDASHPKVKYDPDWRAIITSETDAEGWQYATSFHHSPSWGAVPMKKVRRRLWLKTGRSLPQSALATVAHTAEEETDDEAFHGVREHTLERRPETPPLEEETSGDVEEHSQVEEPMPRVTTDWEVMLAKYAGRPVDSVALVPVLSAPPVPEPLPESEQKPNGDSQVPISPATEADWNALFSKFEKDS